MDFVWNIIKRNNRLNELLIFISIYYALAYH